MYILEERSLRDGYLDYHLTQGHARVSVRGWWVMMSVKGMYIERPHDWRIIWNYFWKLGPRALVRKVLSRSRERLRNRRVLAIGVGTICEPEAAGSFTRGEAVVFLAPCHPPCVERVVLPPRLMIKAPAALMDRIGGADGIRYIADRPCTDEARFATLAGWSEYAGRPLPDTVDSLLGWALEQWQLVDPNAGRILPLPAPSPVCEVMTAPRGGSRPARLRAVLFGLGNHAKTLLIPSISPHIRIERIHEIDPTQISRTYRNRFAIDSSPTARDDERYDVYFIAGYHHTHAELAAHALRQGAWVVVEKPLVTTERELETLLAALKKHPGRLFGCFHKRYNSMWRLAREDLGVAVGRPIHMNCLIYEIQVPRLHWYTWPNSGSRVVSNGCHWLDLFLFLNDFACVRRHHLWLAGNLDVHMSVELENGACMSACLTDIGSPRIGVQDIVELRAGEVTVRVQNEARYFSEDSRKVLRRCRQKNIHVLEEMYGAITDKIVRGEDGDSFESVERTSRLMLDMEKALQEALPKGKNLW